MSDLTTEPGELDYQTAHSLLEQLAREASRERFRKSDRSIAPEPATLLPEPGPEARNRLPRDWNEHTLRGLIEMLPDALVVINRDGLIVLANARTEQLFGYERGELLGRPVELLVPEPHRTLHVAHRTAYFDSPRVRPMGVGLELRGRRRDGEVFPVEISLSPLQTEHGTLVTAVVRDISSRKREEAKLRTLVENIPAVTFIAPLDASAAEFYVSPQIEQLLGFSQKEWLEDPVLWHRQLHPDDRERWNVQFTPTCASGEPFRSVYRFVSKDGRVVWVHGSAQMVRSDDGQAQFLQGIAFDITAIKEAEEAERERARLTALQAAIGAAVTRADTVPAMLQRCARSLEQHLDFAAVSIWTLDGDPGTLRQQAHAGLHTPDAICNAVAAARRPLVIQPGEDARIDPVWAREEKITALVGVPLLIEDRAVGVVVVLSRRDVPPELVRALQQVADEITLGVSRRWAEEALYRLNAELDKRVRERTEELARSMAELREKSEELEQFAHVASHDLREPLRTLVNWPQRLQKQYAGKLDPQADEWINRIINGADRMRRLIDNLSHYARVLRRDRTFSPTSLAAVCAEACSNLQAALEQSEAELIVGELPTVQGNQQQLMLLFQNLLGNALKFCDTTRRARIEVGSQRHGDDWLVWARDNGIGIEPRYLKRIFGLGERLHPASKYAGTGFGLAICEKIVVSHGGRIWAASEPGQGSTFYFTVPAMPEERGVSPGS